MMDLSAYSPAIGNKVAEHASFWAGKGPSLLFIPRRLQPLYDLANYRKRFENPAAMLEAEVARAAEIMEWPTDGIPTVRPNLGTVFVPAAIGQSFILRDGSMPWPGEPMSRDELRELEDTDLDGAELTRRALELYRLSGEYPSCYAYHADTQGVFDLAHIMYGTSIFTDLATESERDWIRELMDLCLGWFLRMTVILKDVVGEPRTEMIHGHGTEQGLYFPTSGARISEDTATLLSPEMIERDLLPWMERSAEPFGGVFVHYCGKHDFLFELLCEQPWCRAIDLGNPEMYDLDELLPICARTGTVFHSRVAPLEGEGWRAYGRRVGAAVDVSGARCVIRATVAPPSRDQAQEMLDSFHEATLPR